MAFGAEDSNCLFERKGHIEDAFCGGAVVVGGVAKVTPPKTLIISPRRR